MKVAITNPFAWPHVRRGSERLLNDLACYLHRCGHEVTVYAMAPEAGRQTRDGITYHLVRERLRLPLRQLNSLHYFAWKLQAELRDSDFDVVFCLNYFDAYAALRARERFALGYKVVFQSVGIPTRPYFRQVPLDRFFIRKVLAHADACVVLSRFARDSLRSDFGIEAQVLPPPVFAQAFAESAAEDAPQPPPSLLFVGAVEETRKGARLLCRAFVRLRHQYPQLRLRFAGRAGAATQAALLGLPGMAQLRDSVDFLGLGELASLPAQYAQAAVTVLPAVWEAFGLVLVESLAAGTPVVGARHGGISDIVEGPLVGELFDPQPFETESHAVDALVAAVARVLERGKTPAVRAACRARAQDFSWQRLGPAYQVLVEDLARATAALEPAHG